MAKRIIKPTPENGTADVLQPSVVIPGEDPGKSMHDGIPLKYGEVLLSPLDENGNEGVPFKVSYSTYKRYYGNTEKFTLKKT